MSYKIIGKCSICGGDVVVPTVWLGIFPPRPTCRQCGAVARDNRKIIDMEPGPKPDYIRPRKPVYWVRERKHPWDDPEVTFEKPTAPPPDSCLKSGTVLKVF